MDKLDIYHLNSDPLSSFTSWYEEAVRCEQNAESMTLTTVDHKSRPNARAVLYKGIKEGGLTFYTNYLSPKARELESNPEACMVFYWHVSKRQVRLHGRVKRMSRSGSEHYFQSRDRDSQLASYISEQSAPIADKAALLAKLSEARQKLGSGPIPTPEHWGGFVFDPYEIEFFVYGEHRLNDRFLYRKNESSTGEEWTVTRLQP